MAPGDAHPYLALFCLGILLERVAGGFKLAVDKLVDNIEDRWTGPVVKNCTLIGIELAQNEVGVADLAAQ